MIEVKNINKLFNGYYVLKDVFIIFEQGKVNFIIGVFGQGKLVLVKCVVGFYEVDNGVIFYDGWDFMKMDWLQWKEICQEIGMLFQGLVLFDFMMVEQNVMFFLIMFIKMIKKEMLDWVNFCFECVNLKGKNYFYLLECFGGMQK